MLWEQAVATVNMRSNNMRRGCRFGGNVMRVFEVHGRPGWEALSASLDVYSVRGAKGLP